MPNKVLTSAIDALASSRDLSTEQTSEVLAEIMRGQASEIEIAGFLIALRTKGETVEELAGLARTMREFAAAVPVARDDLLDTAGTGGGRRTFNVSTTAALIAAGAGCAVAKHGNRSATGLSGSADLLEALGARIDLGPEQVAACIQETGFGFMFAPAHHAATRFVIPVRAGLAVRTVFNLLGPLTNPAGAPRQLIGISDPSFLETIAGALAMLGTERALVVSGQDGVDEVSTVAPTDVVEVDGQEIRRFVLRPEDVGVTPVDRADLDQLAGGEPERNAEIALAIFEGESGPRADFAALNAGAAIYAAGGVESIAEGVEAGRQAIADGRAAQALQGYVEATRRHAPAESAR
jgi:anthranilate phosphoribosyltransferase